MAGQAGAERAARGSISGARWLLLASPPLHPVRPSAPPRAQVVAQAVINPAAIDVTLEDVGGLDHIIEDVTRNVITPMRHPEHFRSNLLRQKRGVLLYGPPGTGGWVPGWRAGWQRGAGRRLQGGCSCCRDARHASHLVCRLASSACLPAASGLAAPSPCAWQARRCWPRLWLVSATPASSSSSRPPS